ncbi:MAG: hypothetical protein GX552_16460 [Chloroflexi bacterium]|nr:hypothetical protein [Chloroflexota bacterium]
MARTLTVDTITLDPANHEFVLYFVEDGPWPENPLAMKESMVRIQGRIFDAIDAIVNGIVAAKYPESSGMAFRIQVDSPSGVPDALSQIVTVTRQYVVENNEYRTSIANSHHVQGLRIVTGHEMGRFSRKAAKGL